MDIIVPPNPDWRWLGCRTPKTIGKAAAGDSSIRWLQNAYAWLWNRLDAAQRESLPKPSPTAHPAGPQFPWIPVLGVGGGKGVLGFLAVDSVPKFGPDNDTGEGDEHRRNAYGAAKVVFELFHSLDHDLGNPSVALQIQEGGGTSLSLPAIFSALGRILGVTWPDDIASTGCLKDEKLVPVAAETLPQKIDAARRFGYKRLVLVQGQEGIPDNPGLETIFVDPDPLLALFDLLKLAEHDKARDQRLAKLLAVFGKKSERGLLARMEGVTQPFTDNPNTSRLVRHVAYDIRSRSALHAGETAKSEDYRNKAGELEWYDFPTGWLGHALRYDQVASRAVLALDMGLWDDDEPIYEILDRRLDHLLAAKSEKIADSYDLLAILALANTRARRRRTQARLEQSPAKLQTAWDDLTLLYRDWNRLFECCKDFDKDSDFSRQRNQCMEAIVDYRNITGRIPDWPYVEEFLEISGNDFDLAEIGNAYDLICWIERQFLLDTRFDVDSFLAKADGFFLNHQNYPDFIPYEKLLVYRLGNESQCRHAANQLQQSKHLDRQLSPTSVLTLLALRTRAALEMHGVTFDFKPILPPPESPLYKIADELLRENSTLIERCPY